MGYRNFRFRLLTSLCMVAVPTIAEAQNIEELVVTARKREETLQEVPIAISAFSADKLYSLNVNDLRDITKFTPGLSYENTTFNTNVRFLPQVRFRGMSTNAPQPNSQVGAVFLDGIFIVGGAQSITTDDVERVEVLKGPQNTYFGRNTFGGAINFVTKTPGNEYKGSFSGKMETRDTFKASASLEGPLVKDKLAARVIATAYQDGAMYKSSDGGDVGRQTTQSITTTFNFTPTDALTIKLRGHIQSDADFGNANYALRTQTDFANCRQGTINWYCGAIPEVGDTVKLLSGGTRTVTADGYSQDTLLAPAQLAAIGRGAALKDFLSNANGIMNDVKFYNKLPALDHFGSERRQKRISMQWTYDFAEGYALAGNLAYGEMHYAQLTDADQQVGVLPGTGTRVYTFTPFQTSDLSAEVRVTSPQDQRFRWLAGANHFAQNLDGSTGSAIKTLSAITGLANTNVWQNSDRDRSFVQGVFAAASFDIFSTLTLDLESRYQVDHLKAFQQTAANQFSPVFRVFKDWLPRAILSYKPTKETNIYGSWSRGALPGLANIAYENVINQIAAFPANPVGTTNKDEIRKQLNGLLGVDVPLTLESERIDQFEIGVKQQFWERRAFINLSGYYISWKNQKQPATAIVAGATLQNGRVLPTSGDLNGDGSADTLSVRIPGRSRIYGLEFDAGVQPLKQLSLTISGEFVKARYRAPFPGGGVVASYAGTQELGDKQLFLYPVNKLALNTRWQDNLNGGNWDYYIQTSVTHSGRYYSDEANLSWVAPYWLVNASMGIQKENVLFEVYVNNLTNFQGWITGRRNTAPDNAQTIAMVPARKQAFGVRTKFDF